MRLLAVLQLLAFAFAREPPARASAPRISTRGKVQHTGWKPPRPIHLAAEAQQSASAGLHASSAQRELLLLLATIVVVAIATGTTCQAACGAVAATAILPLAYAFDRAIMLNASGKRRMEAALRDLIVQFFTRIGVFCDDGFFLQALALVGTYCTANMASATGLSPVPRLAVVSSVATGLSIHKDTQLAQAAGVREVGKFPLISQFFFLCRDVINTACVFLLPGIVAARVRLLFGLSAAAASVAAQFLCPLIGQLFQTSSHLLGLTFYNLPDASALERARTVGRQFGKSYVVRMTRTAVAYCIGGTINTALLSMGCLAVA